MPRHTPTEPDPLGALVNNASSTPVFGATPIMQQGSLPLEQRTANTGSTTHQEQCDKPLGAFMMFSKRNQNGPFLECKFKRMSQWRQRMSQSLGTGGPRARNVCPFLRGTGNPHSWITEQDGPFS